MRLFPGIARDTRILLADQPVDDAQRQNSRRESEQFNGSHIMQIQQDEFAGNRQEGDQDDGPYPDDVLMLGKNDQQGVFELKRDDNSKDRAKNRLEDRLVDRIDSDIDDQMPY